KRRAYLFIQVIFFALVVYNLSTRININVLQAQNANPTPSTPPPATVTGPVTKDPKATATTAKQRKLNDPVSTATGVMSFNVADFSYSRQGFPLEYRRYYSPHNT